MYDSMSALAAQYNGTVLDLRSDTVTQPDAAMRAVMAEAPVGDDVYGEDPSIIALQQRVADITGKDAGLFLPSCTMSNLVAMLCHTARGDEIILGKSYHIYKYEAGGSAALGGAMSCALNEMADGGLDPDDIARAIKVDDVHFPVSKVLSLENTATGKAVPLARIQTCTAVARDAGMITHLDGARFFNATTKLGISGSELADPFDSVSICLSKGLGAPVGAVLVGSRDFIAKALRARKLVGGGMRQAGILAAAGIYALEHNLSGLAQDHARAQVLTNALSEISPLHVAADKTDTNMVFMRPEGVEPLRVHLGERGINMAGGTTIRLVLHRDIDDDGLDRIIDAMNAFYKS